MAGEPESGTLPRLRVMFVSPYCLLDPTSGASQSCRAILERLAERGHAAIALGATVFDRPRFATPEAFYQAVGARIGLLQTRPGQMIAAGYLRAGGVEHVMMRTQSQTRLAITALEEELFSMMLEQYLEKLPPDVVLCYGGRVGDLARYRKIRDRRIPIVFYLGNPDYRSPETFSDIAAAITISDATADLYRRRLGLDVVPIGMFVSPFPPGPIDGREFCTFINPEPAKGVALFGAIVRECERRGLDVRFLVVESRSALAPALERLGMRPEALPNVRCWPAQSDMTEVWSRTKVLLVPSLWHESGPRIIVEALSAHIPSLATLSGGSAAMLNGSGHLFRNPLDSDAQEKKDYLRPFASGDVEPWVDKIEQLFSDGRAYASEVERARRAWETHPCRDDIGRLEKLLADVVRATA